MVFARLFLFTPSLFPSAVVAFLVMPIQLCAFVTAISLLTQAASAADFAFDLGRNPPSRVRRGADLLARTLELAQHHVWREGTTPPEDALRVIIGTEDAPHLEGLLGPP